MHILFVCRMLPHSLVRDSGRLDTYHYIAEICKLHSVSLIAFVASEDEQGLAEMEALCHDVKAVPYSHHQWGPRLRRAWFRVWQPKVYGRNRSYRYQQALQQLVGERQFDVAVVDGMMADYGRFLQDIPAVLDEVDLFFSVAHQYFRDENRWLPKIWNGIDWIRTFMDETSHLRNYSGIFVRSSKDETVVREFAPEQHIAVLPPWFEGLEELASLPIVRPKAPTLLFMGAMNIPANITAVTFFANEVLPLVKAQKPDVQLLIVGSQPSATVRRLADLPEVQVTGEVPRLAPYYAQASIVIVPLFTGGGIIVKTLNGLASGKPVVTTAIGNSGTGAKDGLELNVVAPKPKAMAAAILNLLADDEEWMRLAYNGRKFIQANYDWSKTVSRMLEFLDMISKV